MCEKLRDSIEFNCPRCKGEIKVRRREKIFETCFRPGVTLREAEKVIMTNHYRVAHTDYEDAVAREGQFPNFEELKRRFDEKAVELLKKDGLLLPSGRR